MSFEVKDKDLLARIGRLKTKTTTVETPLLFPVINPSIQPIPPQCLKDEYGFEAVITNAYILRKRFQTQVPDIGLHKFLDFDGAVMTDSGAYQILVYGNVEIKQPEIIAYQEDIGSDIATILDIPTGWKITKEKATQTVKETLRRAKEFVATKKRDDILWVGPVQGGRHLDLVAKSATEMGSLPFQIHALGSPTEIMESYRFDVLVDMIFTAKMNLPPERPLHLFGAGHPAMFSLAVAAGCDLFDSAAYALYARENRYMTENGTWRLEDLDFFPCQCPKCRGTKPREVQAREPRERELFLAGHNLHVCQGELNRVKQSIRDGRLWEHMEIRAHAHPKLLTALKRLKTYEEFIEKHSPISKRKGLFFFNSTDLSRPEIIHHRKKLRENYSPPETAEVLLFIPQTNTKPFHKAKEIQRILQLLQKIDPSTRKRTHVCVYAAPFGVIPLELDEVYPLSQHEAVTPNEKEVEEYVAQQAADYVKRSKYKSVVLINDSENWGSALKNAVKNACASKGLQLNQLNFNANRQKTILTRLKIILSKNLRGKS